MTDLPTYSPKMGTHGQRIVERLEGRVRELERQLRELQASAARDVEIIGAASLLAEGVSLHLRSKIGDVRNCWECQDRLDLLEQALAAVG